MGSQKSFFFLGAVSALIFYILLVLLVLIYINSYKKSKLYVPKKSENIEVSLVYAAPKKSIKRALEEKKVEKNVQVKPVAKKSSVKEKDIPLSKPVAIASLFDTIKADTSISDSVASRLANAPKIEYEAQKIEQDREKEASKLIKDINLSKPEVQITAKDSGIGEVDKYISSLYDIIYKNWHPESIYAGSEAKVHFVIEPDGSFNFSLSLPSDNIGFNTSLIEFINSLKKKGLPPHDRGKSLNIDIEFKAKE